jgi:flagellar basal-body rod protein FlgG
MYKILSTGKAGMKSNQFKMDAIADNIANVSSNGYKNKDVAFQELLTNDEINVGSKANLARHNLTQGVFTESAYDYHMAIAGDGFFGLLDEDSVLMLTRNGAFHMDGEKNIVNDQGYPVYIDYTIPKEEWPDKGISIASNGEIRATVETGTDIEQIFLGRIVLFTPGNTDSLISLGEGRYLPPDNGQLYNSLQNEEMFGDIHQYYLESSNVDLTQSFADMIMAQRAYSLNARAVQTTDEIMNMINDIKR